MIFVIDDSERRTRESIAARSPKTHRDSFARKSGCDCFDLYQLLCQSQRAGAHVVAAGRRARRIVRPRGERRLLENAPNVALGVAHRLTRGALR